MLKVKLTNNTRVAGGCFGAFVRKVEIIVALIQLITNYNSNGIL